MIELRLPVRASDALHLRMSKQWGSRAITGALMDQSQYYYYKTTEPKFVKYYY